MASGNTLVTFFPTDNEPAAANMATPLTRNSHPTLRFDDTTQEIAVFTGIMPRHYAGGGVTVYLHASLVSATTGTLGWDVSFERMDAATDIDADSYASAQAVTPATVPGTSGFPLVLNAAVTNGANMDSIAVGDAFRLRVRRDVANDTATGDAELLAVEIKET